MTTVTLVNILNNVDIEMVSLPENTNLQNIFYETFLNDYFSVI